MKKGQKQGKQESKKAADAGEGHAAKLDSRPDAKSDSKMDSKTKAGASGCGDSKCPLHGDLKVRGRTFIGIVSKSQAQKTATVVWERRYFIPKYERYEKRRTKIHVHNPPCMSAIEGDIVKISECRPLSKTKKFVIVEKMGRKEIRPLIEEPEAQKKAPEKADKDKPKGKVE